MTDQNKTSEIVQFLWWRFGIRSVTAKIIHITCEGQKQKINFNRPCEVKGTYHIVVLVLLQASTDNSKDTELLYDTYVL